MKQILIFILVVGLGFKMNAQNLSVEGAFSGVGTNSTITTGTVDTTYFKASIPSTGDLTIFHTFVGESGNTINGTLTLWVSLDNVTYTLYPSHNVTDSSTVSFANVPLESTPTATPTSTYAYTYTTMWTFPYKTSDNVNIMNGNPFKWYLLRFISTTSTSGTLTAGARYQVRKEGL